MVLPETKYSEYRQRVAFADQLLERVRALPGVVSAGTTTNIPLERQISFDAMFEVEGRPRANPNEVPITSHRIVSPDYLETLGATLVKGRLIDKTDRADTLPVVVVSEEFARQAWPGGDPIGKKVRRIRFGHSFPWMTVVGVVRDVKEDLFNYRINRPVWYLPSAQVENTFPTNLVVRAKIDPTSLTGAIRDAVHYVDSDQPISDVMTMNTNLSGVLVTERFGSVLMAALASSGLLLAAMGLYGVMAYAVRQRTGEIGLRVALGAQRRHVLGLVMADGAKLTLSGLAIGLIAAWGATRLVVSLLFGVRASDPATFVGVSILLGTIALLACYLPARSAMDLDPVEALRYE
jgi:putative ABC transport system permease protein